MKKSTVLVSIAVLVLLGLVDVDAGWSQDSQDHNSRTEYCGRAVAEYVFKRNGIQPIGTEFDQLSSLRMASFADLRAAFEANGLEVYSIAVRSRSWLVVWWMRRVASRQAGEFVFLVMPSIEDDVSIKARVGHYFLLDKFLGQVDVELLEPCSGEPVNFQLPYLLEHSGGLKCLYVVQRGKSEFPTNFVILKYVGGIVLIGWSTFVVGLKVLRRLTYGFCSFRGAQILGIAALCIHSFGCSGDVKNSGNSYRIRNSSVDFGRTRVDSVASMEVFVDNFSPEPLSLRELTLSCSCIKTDFSPRVVPPFQSTHFCVQVVPRRPGAHRQKGSIVFGDLSRKNFEILYEGVRQISLKPASNSLGRVSSCDEWPRKLILEFADIDTSIKLDSDIALLARDGDSLELMYRVVNNVTEIGPEKGLEIEINCVNFGIGMFTDLVEVEFMAMGQRKTIGISFSGWFAD